MKKIILCGAVLLLSLSCFATEYVGDINKKVRKALKNGGLDSPELVVVDGRGPVSPQYRDILGSHLRSGKTPSVIFIGDKAFDYTPLPKNFSRIVDLSDSLSYKVEQDRREMKARFSEIPEIRRIAGPDGKPAVEMSTKSWGAKDTFLKIDVHTPLVPSQTVLQLCAKGNAWMDLLSLEIRDRDGRVWLSFLPVSCEWARYEVSLADFIPQGRSRDEGYELLRPQDIASVWLGTNLKVIWYEKPTYLALSEIGFCGNAAPFFAPTSRLSKMESPFRWMGTSLPENIYDPAFVRDDPTIVSSTVSSDRNESNWNYADRESRIVRLPHGTVEFFATGVRAGAAVALLDKDAPESEIVDAARLMTRTPMCIATTMNTSKARDGWHSDVVPSFRQIIRNPLPEKVRAKVYTDLGGTIKDSGTVDLEANGLQERLRQLPAVPEGFPRTIFEWSVAVETPDCRDVFRGSVNLEKALLAALRHLVVNQRSSGDARISNHYFGDAYGVRAIVETVYHARRDPAFLERNAGELKIMGLDEMLDCAYAWLDMMCDRQDPDGAMPMGYSEPKPSCNVADMGEVTTCVFQMLPFIEDEGRRERYSECFERTVKWMENFYIGDEETVRMVAERWPEEARKGLNGIGRYGLGTNGGKVRLWAPIWVNELIMPVHCYLAHFGNEEQREFFGPIFRRHSDYMVTQKFSSAHYYHSESSFWHWYVTEDPGRKALILENINETMFGNRFAGVLREPWYGGGREALSGAVLLYYQRMIEDFAGLRASLLKYYWAYANSESFWSVERFSPCFPKAYHGEGIAASKFAGSGAVMAVEAIWPGATGAVSWENQL